MSFSLRRCCVDAIKAEGIHGTREAHGDHIKSLILSRSNIMSRSSKLLRSYGLVRPFIADTFVGQGVVCVWRELFSTARDELMLGTTITRGELMVRWRVSVTKYMSDWEHLAIVSYFEACHSFLQIYSYRERFCYKCMRCVECNIFYRATFLHIAWATYFLVFF